MSYLSSLNNLLTTTTSRYASLRRNILSSSSEDDTVSAALVLTQPYTNHPLPLLNPPSAPPQLNNSELNRTGHYRPGILPRLPSPPSLLHRKKPPLPRLAGRRSPRGSARATTCSTTTLRYESAAR